MNEGNVKALSETLPNIWPHAIAPGFMDTMSGFERMRRGVEEVSTKLANVLQSVRLRFVDFGPGRSLIPSQAADIVFEHTKMCDVRISCPVHYVSSFLTHQSVTRFTNFIADPACIVGVVQSP